MRHLDRTQKTCVGFLGDIFKEQIALIENCPTERMRADLFTKNIKPIAWSHALTLIGMQHDTVMMGPG